MTEQILLIICAFAVIATALVSGVFLAFSDFIMKSLGSVAPASGITSMQAINRIIYGSIFVKLLIGLAPFTLALTAYSYFQASSAVTVWLVLGTLIYLIGVILVTMKFNVPMNHRLDAMDETSPQAVTYWQTYLTDWTRLNHIRTIAPGLSAMCFLIACLQLVSRGVT